ncbi:hypothetical protein F2Q69_00015522 [Brassica cretica]|uniref:Uncharacterized protein n=1 Tax=Brassica cretica TaxID=69181 RepID=A0A8S9R9E4_BRACR|nr:hypothetical protein F2Q69_00015522 [Brassica cretica]
MKSSEYPEEFPRKFLGIFRGNTKFGFLGISSEYTDRIPRKYQSVGIFRGKMCSSEKTDEFRGNIKAVGEPLGDFTKFRGNSDELAVGVGIPSEFRRNFLGMSAGFKL